MKTFTTIALAIFFVISNITLYSQKDLLQNFQPTLLWEQGSSIVQPMYLSDNLVVTAGYYSASLIDLTTKKLIRNYIPPFDSYNQNIHISKDNTLLLICSAQFIRIFDIETGVLLKSLENPAKNRYFTHAEFSPDASEFVVSRNEGSIFVYDANTLELKHTAKQHQSWCSWVTYSNNGQLIASSGAVHAIALYNANNLELVGTFPNDYASITCLTFNSNDSKLAAVGSSDNIWIYDINSKEELLKISTASSSGLFVNFGNNDSLIAVNGRNQTMIVFELDNNTSSTYKFIEKYSISNKLSLDSRNLIVVDSRGILSNYELKNQIESPTIIPTTNSNVPERTIRFSDDGSYLVIGSDLVTKVLDVQSGDFVRLQNSHTSMINNFAISSDASFHLSGSAFNFAIFGSDSNYRLPTEGYSTPVYSVDMSTDGTIGITGDSNGYISKWDLTTLQQQYRIPNEFSVHDIKLSPDNKYFAAAFGDSVTKIFDTETGNVIFTFKSHHIPSLLQWSADGKLIYMSDLAGRFYSISMDSQTGTELFGHTSRIISFRVNPSNQLLYFVDNNEVFQYDLIAKSLLSRFKVSAPNNIDYQIRSAEINTDCTKLALYNNYLNLMMFSIEDWVTSVSDVMGEQNTIQTYPNPSTNRITFTIEIPLVNPQLTIIDAIGRTKEVNDIEIGNNQISFDVSNLPNGSYVISIKEGTNTIQSKFVISK